jgi:superfamily II DNA or RNA helicase
VTQAVVGGGLYFRPADGAPYAHVYRCENRAYKRALQLREQGKRVNLPPRWIEAASLLPEGHAWAGGLVLPRMVRPPGVVLVDRRAMPEGRIDVDLADTFRLKDYQQEAINVGVKNETALLQAPCGSGKTSMGVGLIARLKVRTVVLADQIDLLVQWKERCAAQLKGAYTVGMVGDGVDERDADVVFASIQTLANWTWVERYEWAKGFGLLLVDECHGSAAATDMGVLATMPQKYRIGLTATPNRDDGLSDMVFWNFGKPAWKITVRELAERGEVLLPDITPMITDWEPSDPKMDWVHVVTELCEDDDRNALLVLQARLDVAAGGMVLMLSDRVPHCERLAEMCRAAGLRAEALTGQVKRKGKGLTRNDIMELARARGLDVLTGTTVADQGLDIPPISTVMLCTPTRALSRVQQRIGRAMRLSPGKTHCRVIDVQDKYGPMQAQSAHRQRFYRRMLDE